MSQQFFLVILLLINIVENAEILGVFPVRSRSHYSFNNAIMTGLAAKGHRVTVLGHFSLNKPVENYTDVDLGTTDDTPDYVDSVSVDHAKKLTGFFNYLEIFIRDELEEVLCVAMLSHPYMRDIINSKIKPPDLIIVETICTHCVISVAQKFDIPTVAIVSAVDMAGVDYAIGNPIIPSYFPSLMSGCYTQNMNFFERVWNTFQHTMMYAVQNWFVKKRTLRLDKTYVGNKDVTMHQLYERINLVLYNSHSSFFNRPLVPNAIEVGGIHIKNSNPLPKDIQKFIDESVHGVVFVSFGSTIKVSSLPAEKIKMFKDVFSKIPQRVIWRCDALNVTDLPKNIMIGYWFPQRDILEHKNVKTFISHGGIFGTYEAIHTGTPVIGIPFMFDQFMDIKLLVEKDVAILLDYETLTSQSMLKALNDIHNNSKYYNNMQKLSQIFKDRPMSPLGTATYWIEYVLRHKGAPHLRIKAADMTFFEYLLLDVISFVLIIFILTIYLIYFLIKLSLSVIISKKSIKSSYSKKIR